MSFLEEVEFMQKEHEAGSHTSEDWFNLKDRCLECNKQILAMRNIIPSRESLGTSIGRGAVEDMTLSPNPLE